MKTASPLVGLLVGLLAGGVATAVYLHQPRPDPIAGTGEPEAVQPAPQQRERVSAERESEARVVRNDIFPLGGRRKTGRRLFDRRTGEKRGRGFAPRGQPVRIAAVTGK